MSVQNPSIFIGETVLGATPNTNLTVDANGKIAAGLTVFSSIEVSDTSTISAPVATDALMTTMTIPPTPGRYIAWFSCDINSAPAGAAVSVSIYVGGTQVSTSLRKVIPTPGGLLGGTGRAVVAINQTVTVTTGQSVEIRWSTSNAGPTAAARTLTLLRIA